MRAKAIIFDRTILRMGIERDHLVEILNWLPHGAKIIGFSEQWHKPVVSIIVECNSYDEVPASCELPEIILNIVQAEDGSISVSDN